MEAERGGSDSGPGRKQVRLELDLGTPQISGTVLGEAAGPQPFAGWLELVTLLEAARTEDA